MATFSTELADRLLQKLFTKTFRDSKARFDIRTADTEAFAKLCWGVHGVCLECRCKAILSGRCIECGAIYAENNLRVGIRAQVEWAKKALAS